MMTLARPNRRSRVATCPLCHLLYLNPPDCPVLICPHCVPHERPEEAHDFMFYLVIGTLVWLVVCGLALWLALGQP